VPSNRSAHRVAVARRRPASALLVLLLVAVAGAGFAGRSARRAVSAAESVAGSAVPLGLWEGFIANQGQFASEVDFVARGAGWLLRIEAGDLRWTDAQGRELGRLGLVQGGWKGSEPLPGRLNFFLGANEAHWARGVPRFGRLAGIGRPGGGETWTLGLRGGDLQLVCTGGPACRAGAVDRALRPLLAAGLLQVPAMVAPRLLAGPALALQLPGAPTLRYATYLGGGQDDQVRGLAVDRSGRAVVAGTTNSADLPLAGRPYQGVIGSSGQIQDAFAARLSPDGTRLEWASFLGGSRQDEALDLAVDLEDRVALVGYTQSGDWPMVRPVQARVNLADGIFSGDAFAARLSADGEVLDYSTPLGGTARDIAKAVAVDGQGNTVVGGLSASNFPTVNFVQRFNRGAFDAFIFKLNPAGDALLFSTLLGGTADDMLRDLVVDEAGDIHAVGETRSLNFRFKSPAFQVGNAGGLDAFYLKLRGDGSELLASSNYGGKADDSASGVAVGADGSATFIGQTRSADLPRQKPMQAGRAGDTDFFLARFGPDGLRLDFASYWGGSGDEGQCAPPEALRAVFTPTPDPRGADRLPGGSRFSDAPPADLAVDAAGRIALAACSQSANYPLAAPLPFGRRGRHNLVLSVLDPAAGTLLLSTWLGGSGTDIARRLEWAPDGALYLAGQTDATDFPIWPDPPLQGRRRGQSDGFVLKLGLPEGLHPSPMPSPSPTPSPGATATTRPSVTTTREPTPTAPPPDPTAPASAPPPSPTTGAIAPPTATVGPSALYLPRLER